MVTIQELREMHPEPVTGESKEWMQRVDKQVDEIAYLLGLEPIPYKAAPDSEYRFIAPYRLEALKREIRENR